MSSKTTIGEAVERRNTQRKQKEQRNNPTNTQLMEGTRNEMKLSKHRGRKSKHAP